MNQLPSPLWRLTPVLLVLFLVCTAPPDVRAASDDTMRATLGTELLPARDTLSFKLGDSELGTWSAVDWSVDGVLAAIEADLALPLAGTTLVCDGRYARSLSLDGSSEDRDWRPWLRPGLSDYSEADTEAELESLRVRLGLDLPVGSHATTLRVFTGYIRHMLDMDDRNMRGSFDYGAESISWPGLVGTYSVDFSAVTLGLETVAELGPQFSASAKVEILTSLTADARGRWVRVGHAFDQEASGDGFAASVRLGYRLSERLAVTGGFEWMSMTADRSGRQNGVRDGSAYDSRVLREISMEHQAIGLGLEWAL